MTRFVTPLIALLVCSTALTGCASDGAGLLSSLNASKKTASVPDPKTQAAADPALPTDIESGVRQAQLQRLAGNYDDAIHTLSQLMLVASDDSRVVGEYGKTLAQKGRAQEAVQFLTRATELQPTDWSLYSALGVAYDQTGDQASARAAYEHALQLHPNEPSVLNNYALSRMLANDPNMARQLITRAQNAGGASDPKIARNIELVNKLTPVPTAAEQKAVSTQTPGTAVHAPTPVSSQLLPALTPSTHDAQAQQAQQHPAPSSQVVMQAVPADPLAGPVKTASHAPAPPTLHVAAKTGDPTSKPVAKADTKVAAKTDTRPVKPDDAKSVAKGSESKTPKTAETKTDAKSDAKSDAKPDNAPAVKSAIPALRQTASAY